MFAFYDSKNDITYFPKFAVKGIYESSCPIYFLTNISDDIDDFLTLLRESQDVVPAADAETVGHLNTGYCTMYSDYTTLFQLVQKQVNEIMYNENKFKINPDSWYMFSDHQDEIYEILVKQVNEKYYEGVSIALLNPITNVNLESIFKYQDNCLVSEDY